MGSTASIIVYSRKFRQAQQTRTRRRSQIPGDTLLRNDSKRQETKQQYPLFHRQLFVVHQAP